MSRAVAGRFAAFRCESMTEFYMVRDVVSLGVIERGMAGDFIHLRDLEGLLRAALGAAIVNGQSVFDWLNWGELWAKKCASANKRGGGPRRSFDLLAYGTEEYGHALAAITALPSFHAEAPSLLKKCPLEGLTIDEILVQRDDFAKRSSLPIPSAPVRKTVPPLKPASPALDARPRRTDPPPATAEQGRSLTLLQRVGASIESQEMAMKLTQDAEVGICLKDVFVKKYRLLEKRSTYYSLDIANFTALLVDPEVRKSPEYRESTLAQSVGEQVLEP